VMGINSSKPSLLIVDDDPQICTTLRGQLTEAGFECQLASSGEAALQAMQGRSFDAIISDLNMPGLSGLQLLEEARKEHSRSAFLLATGMDDVGVAIKAMKLGADDYLLKPFRLQTVVTSLRLALQKKRLQRELEDQREHLE
jgi:DNA-binding NtrC family response regulator